MTQPLPTLFKHSKRPSWGLAVIAWERDDKRGYLFENGMLRTLAEPFYRFMVPVEKVDDAGHATLIRLMAQIEVTGGAPSVRTSMSPALRFSLADQVAYFRSEYPEGFGGEWLKKVRGAGAKRRLKRHRDAAVAHAQEDLSLEFLQSSATDEGAADVWRKVASVLDQTDLVPTAQVEALRASAERANAQSVNALLGVLYGQDDLSARFDAYVHALEAQLGKAPNWELASAILGLVVPRECVCVRRTSFQTQADWLLPELRSARGVSALTYSAYSHLARTVCEYLEQHDLPPQDYIDVHDFIKLTTTPSAQSRMLTLQRSEGDATEPDGDGQEPTGSGKSSAEAA